MESQNSNAESKVRKSILQWQLISTGVFMLLLTLFVVSAVLVARSVSELQTSHERFVTAENAATDIDDILFTLTDAETGQRGYLLTQDTSYLVPFKRSESRLPGLLDATALTVAHDSMLSADFIELKARVGDKMNEMRRTLSVAGTSGVDAARDVVEHGEGQAYMTEIRRLVSHMRQQVNQDELQAVEARESLIDRTKLNLVTSTLAVALFLLIAYVLSLRTLDAHRRDQVRREQRSEDLEGAVRERTADLTTAIKELEGFTYSVSHDMRAPLRWIVASSQMILEDHGGGLEPEARELLNRQIAAGNKLSKLIDDLLNYARLSRQPIERRQVDLAAIAKSMLSGEGDVQLISPSKLLAHGDPTLIETVMQNLLENALKYRSTERPLVITLGVDKSAYFVRDTEIGFDQQYMDKIFVPFERLHRDSEYPGTGIGLANVHRIVTRHGGRVWAESEPDHGATFFFTLP